MIIKQIREWDAYSLLDDMEMPIIERPKDIDKIFNEDREVLANIQSPEYANELMFGVAQFLMYMRQQYNIFRSVSSRLKKELERKLMIEASEMKGSSLTERKAIALENNEKLRKESDIIDDLNFKADLIEDWFDDCYEFLNTLKRVHDGLVAEKKNQLRTLV